MTTQDLRADTVFCIHLRSYGFFHSGRERLQNRVLKRVWGHIPGGTLYGAVAAALIRLDGIDDNAQPFEEGSGGYATLLQAVKAGEIRFTPLLPVGDGTSLKSAEAYSRQAARLQTALYADATGEVPTAQDRKLLHTTPHAPQNRDLEKIHSDQVFVLRTHRPLLDYYGFVFGTPDIKDLLKRAFRLFPLMPVGGRGKYSLVEAEIYDTAPLDDFRSDLQAWATQGDWLRLLTPLVLEDGLGATPLLGTGRTLDMPGLRRYRVWRTGYYYNAQEDTFTEIGLEPGNLEADGLLPGGQESEAVRAVPERSRVRIKAGDPVADWFIEGVGNPSWTYLGWGQVVIT